MSAIKEVTFYFANPQQDQNGQPLPGHPPESHTLSWNDLIRNVGFSLSTGEAMFTELSDPNNPHTLRVINGFYFGTGKHGSLLAIQYKYEDGTDGWVEEILAHNHEHSSNLQMIVGDWIKGLNYGEIVSNQRWTGKPFIGYDSDFVEVKIKRNLPDLVLTLKPTGQEITVGESITFEYNGIHHCEGDIQYEWLFDSQYIQELQTTENRKTLQFRKEGIYHIELTASNTCGQTTTQRAVVIVNDAEENTCDLQLSPKQINIYLGESAQFTAIHPYQEIGKWGYDVSVEVLEESIKTLQIKPKTAGSYLITFQVGDCQDSALLYVREHVSEEEWEEPKEPSPPSLPNTPPETMQSNELDVELKEASITEPPLYKQPVMMKRNARYRGHRESEKVLNDHQEQIFDIRKLHQDLTSLMNMKQAVTRSWFYNETIESFFKNSIEIESQSINNIASQANMPADSEGHISGNMVKLNNIENEKSIGLLDIKKRVIELDEKVSEIERRIQEHENAY